jgi:hypothetical protein
MLIKKGNKMNRIRNNKHTRIYKANMTTFANNLAVPTEFRLRMVEALSLEDWDSEVTKVFADFQEALFAKRIKVDH